MKNLFSIIFMLLTVATVQAQITVTNYNDISIVDAVNVTDSSTKINFFVQRSDVSTLVDMEFIALNQIIGQSPALRKKIYNKDTTETITFNSVKITHLYSKKLGMFMYVVDIHNSNLPYQCPVMLAPINQDTFHMYFHKELGIYDYCNKATLTTFRDAKFSEGSNAKYVTYYSDILHPVKGVDRRINGFMLYKDQENCQQYILLSFSDKIGNFAPVTNELTLKVTTHGDLIKTAFRPEKSIKIVVPGFVEIKTPRPLASPVKFQITGTGFKK